MAPPPVKSLFVEDSCSSETIFSNPGISLSIESLLLDSANPGNSNRLIKKWKEDQAFRIQHSEIVRVIRTLHGFLKPCGSVDVEKWRKLVQAWLPDETARNDEVNKVMLGNLQRVLATGDAGLQKQVKQVREVLWPASDQKRCSKDMSYIPAGSFQMGSNKFKNGQPLHTVEVSAYCLGKYEVTNAQFRIFEIKYGPVAKRFGWPPSRINKPNHPVTDVTWEEAKAYCEAQGKRLPTEAEWEKAARGPQGYEYGTSTGLLDISLACFLPDTTTREELHNRVDRTAEIGSYPPNGYGLYDMTGNVWEWVVGLVIRGGSWSSIDPDHLRTSTRRKLHPNVHGDNIGFRCASVPRLFHL